MKRAPRAVRGAPAIKEVCRAPSTSCGSWGGMGDSHCGRAARRSTGERRHLLSRLQVLLPGETAAPERLQARPEPRAPRRRGSPSPSRVNACDASWNLVTHGVPHDPDPELGRERVAAGEPPSSSAGTGDFLVILNAGGNFTVYAHDQTDVTIPDGASSLVRSHRAPETRLREHPRQPDRRHLFPGDDHRARPERRRRERLHRHGVASRAHELRRRAGSRRPA